MRTGKFIILFLIVITTSYWGYSQTSCDTTLWQHIYHPTRLKVIEQCKTVTGTVMAIKREKDGDYHIRVQLDSGQANLLNEKNISAQKGCLVVEIICACKVTQSDAIEPCQGYLNNVLVPKVGQHAYFTGTYVYDTEHGWNEIHPVTSIVLIEF